MDSPTERIVAALREADALREQGLGVAEISATLGVSASTYRRWRQRYADLDVAELDRVRRLEVENSRLRRILVDKELENEALREISRGHW